MLLIGASVTDLHTLGGGVGDILVGLSGVNWLFEIKTEDGTLTPAEEQFRDEWRGQWNEIHSLEEGLRIMGRTR